jgi:hypothetical protein
MSANNELLISFSKDKKKWIVRNVDVDGGGAFLVAEDKTLEGAIEKANKYMEEEEVEYGLRIIPKKQKEIWQEELERTEKWSMG